MKGLILSGGRGLRLRPITHTSAKQLVPVANKPILFHVIETLVAARIRELGIIVGETHAEIEAAVQDGSRWGTRVTYLPQDAPRGLAHAVRVAQPFLGDEPFVMFLGDNLIPDGISAFVSEFEARQPDALVLLARVPEPQRFGVAEVVDGRIVRLEEKPMVPRSDLALVGVYLFGPSVFRAVHAIGPSRRGELEITDAIQYLIDQGARVDAHVIDGWWKDTGRLEDMLEANRIMLDRLTSSNQGRADEASRLIGKVVLEPGAEVINSVIRGPAIIGEGARIIDSYVGPFTSIYFGVELRGSEIQHSIVLEKSRIVDVGGRVEDSLIGKNVLVRRARGRPTAHKFMLGDHSLVELV